MARLFFGQPTFEGYEVMVYNEEGELKLNKIKIGGFNRLPKNDTEVTVFFDEYDSLIDSTKQKNGYKCNRHQV